MSLKINKKSKKSEKLAARHRKLMMYGRYLADKIENSINKDDFISLIRCESSTKDKISFFEEFDNHMKVAVVPRSNKRKNTSIQSIVKRRMIKKTVDREDESEDESEEDSEAESELESFRDKIDVSQPNTQTPSDESPSDEDDCYEEEIIESSNGGCRNEVSLKVIVPVSVPVPVSVSVPVDAVMVPVPVPVPVDAEIVPVPVPVPVPADGDEDGDEDGADKFEIYYDYFFNTPTANDTEEECAGDESGSVYAVNGGYEAICGSCITLEEEMAVEKKAANDAEKKADEEAEKKAEKKADEEAEKKADEDEDEDEDEDAKALANCQAWSW